LEILPSSSKFRIIRLIGFLSACLSARCFCIIRNW
jgi:hypothetical protein